MTGGSRLSTLKLRQQRGGPDEQAKAREYWERYPLVRRPGDPKVIPEERYEAAEFGTA